jgi:hypothetical protein
MGKVAEGKPRVSRSLDVPAVEGKTEEQNLADVALCPAVHAMAVAELFNRGTFGERGTTETFKAVEEQVRAVAGGDLTYLRQMLAAQAITLNSIFTEMARRGGANMGEYIKAMETYLRLAMKAQAQSRATIEALERLTNGHVQTVKHVHVNEGGQAVIADQFHHHGGGSQNGRSIKQPHATGETGEGFPMPSPDPKGDAVPIASGQGT